MARNKKRKKNTQHRARHLSPESYIRKKARNLPIRECYIDAGWRQKGITNIFVIREHKNGNLTFGGYLVDLFCLGIKDAFCNYNQSDSILQRLRNSGMGVSMVPCDYELAHNIIYGAKNYGEKWGFKPPTEWTLAQYILEPEDADVPEMDIEFGEDGLPHYFAGPHDDLHFIKRVIQTLKRNAGQGNYHFTIPTPEYVSELDEIFMDEDI